MIHPFQISYRSESIARITPRIRASTEPPPINGVPIGAIRNRNFVWSGLSIRRPLKTSTL